ncbi:hypothetical protein SPBR_00360 [Sporothrix brasiliensis 5110]|uniref:Heterokaryon incompatibility domain-containing protein n=1 Tax=Sporothrix brasiliensis 5110 TaxID=1398154 RepID=A0A0C2ETR5_9PEZI|nr:uncharacterized protein SPBR_00360 [Sporothrix brasiliensis 5110]KIH89914.1 hypothetical protein SPBR_00360 [Sporothrix brasiliensis 5110]
MTMTADAAQPGASEAVLPLRGHGPPKPENALPYRDKAIDSNGLRLLTIEPAANDDDPVVCTLVETRFGNKPKFHALSYTWGHKTADDPTITLNGFPFVVRHNLFDALTFFRRQNQAADAGQQFWIDAICINQSDVEERNRQVRIMDQIYFRATEVVVWLGEAYERFEAPVRPESGVEGNSWDGITTANTNNTSNDGVGTAVRSGRNAYGRQWELCGQLQVDPYWERVWILQEITKAWTLHVHFGRRSSYTWDEFLVFLRSNTRREDARAGQQAGPLWLHESLRAKDQRGAHTLIELLQDHRAAKCADLHDKVYGLLGMATNGGGFPIDYNKSLFDLWVDTMVFLNGKRLLTAEHNVVFVGQLVREILQVADSDLRLPALGAGGDAAHATYVEQIDARDRVDMATEKRHVLDRLTRPAPTHPQAYHHHATVLGQILLVGPSTESIVAEPGTLSMWTGFIDDLYDAGQVKDAHMESNNLIRVLLGADEAQMAAACVSVPSTVLFAPETFPVEAREFKAADVPGAAALAETDGTEESSSSSPSSLSAAPKLYYLEAITGATRHKMGVAAGLVKAGDIVCEVGPLRLLVRLFREGPLAGRACVVGTALTTEDVCRHNAHAYSAQNMRIIDRYADIYLGKEALYVISGLASRHPGSGS